eukprot:jgi/Galph1/4060/GphlegSOOS_G2714.1
MSGGSGIYQPSGMSLYVGNLDPRVCTELLQEVFELIGPVKLAKVVGDRNTGRSLGFGFVDFYDRPTAIRAMELMHGRRIYGQEIRIDWAHAGAGAAGRMVQEEDLANMHTIFVGNLGPDVDEEKLMKAFSSFPSVAGAKISKDAESGLPAGYGFVSFREKSDADLAMQTMTGYILSGRALRIDWARGKNAVRGVSTSTSTFTVTPKPDIQTIMQQTDPLNVSVYVRGLPSSIDTATIREAFKSFGEIDDVKIPDAARMTAQDRIYAFVKFKSHEVAARAIHDMHGKEIQGYIVQCEWGREGLKSRYF